MELSTIQKILTSLDVGSKAWDILLVGDGSGMSWDMGVGWSCVLVDHRAAQRKLFIGGMNTGTIGLGELFPYFHAMLWYSRNVGNKRLKELQKKYRCPGLINVHIITDSEVTAKQGNGEAARATNTELWAAMDQFVRQGYAFTWHHMGRAQTGLNALTDHMSREARLAIEALRLPEGVSIYDMSPDASDEEGKEE